MKNVYLVETPQSLPVVFSNRQKAIRYYLSIVDCEYSDSEQGEINRQILDQGFYSGYVDDAGTYSIQHARVN